MATSPPIQRGRSNFNYVIFHLQVTVVAFQRVLNVRFNCAHAFRSPTDSIHPTRHSKSRIDTHTPTQPNPPYLPRLLHCNFTTTSIPNKQMHSHPGCFEEGPANSHSLHPSLHTSIEYGIACIRARHHLDHLECLIPAPLQEHFPWCSAGICNSAL
jgi:hypothetical protein